MKRKSEGQLTKDEADAEQSREEPVEQDQEDPQRDANAGFPKADESVLRQRKMFSVRRNMTSENDNEGKSQGLFAGLKNQGLFAGLNTPIVGEDVKDSSANEAKGKEQAKVETTPEADKKQNAQDQREPVVNKLQDQTSPKTENSIPVGEKSGAEKAVSEEVNDQEKQKSEAKVEPPTKEEAGDGKHDPASETNGEMAKKDNENVETKPTSMAEEKKPMEGDKAKPDENLGKAEAALKKNSPGNTKTEAKEEEEGSNETNKESNAKKQAAFSLGSMGPTPSAGFSKQAGFTFSSVASEKKLFTFSTLESSESKPFSISVPSVETKGTSEPSVAPLFAPASATQQAPSILPEQIVPNGEEAEKEEFRAKAKLYELDLVPKTAWRERGVGQLKLNVGKESNSARLIMRSEGSLRLILNANVYKEMKLDRANERSVRFAALDANMKATNYFIRFPVKESLDRLLSTVDKWRERA